jgi:hypothetical protein
LFLIVAGTIGEIHFFVIPLLSSLAQSGLNAAASHALDRVSLIPYAVCWCISMIGIVGFESPAHARLARLRGFQRTHIDNFKSPRYR